MSYLTLMNVSFLTGSFNNQFMCLLNVVFRWVSYFYFVCSIVRDLTLHDFNLKPHVVWSVFVRAVITDGLATNIDDKRACKKFFSSLNRFRIDFEPNSDEGTKETPRSTLLKLNFFRCWYNVKHEQTNQI